MQDKNVMKATGGREASLERRKQLVQGKTALSATGERSRTNEHANLSLSLASATAVQTTAAVVSQTLMASSTKATQGSGLVGRAASLARRAALVQGKQGLQQFKQAVMTEKAAPAATTIASVTNSLADSSRQVSQALRASRARHGRSESEPARPSGRVRESTPIQYPAKVADTTTYAGQKVTGVRIGRGRSMTGDEPGANLPVSGTQYIGTESGYAPRQGGTKVGATRTEAGLTVTGTQVRSTIKITGDESNPALRITGEADQKLSDDLLQRADQGGHSSAQFKRMHEPHGQSVFGSNLGRSTSSIGSRERNRERALEKSLDGQPISGTAVGRSQNVTGDEPGSCRALTGTQYLMPSSQQAQCEQTGNRNSLREPVMGMNGRVDPVTGEKVSLSETWARQRISGVSVEHNTSVTGSEHGVCSTITGTAYVGPGEYEANCTAAAAAAAAQRIAPNMSVGNHVSGNIPLNVERVTGTHRGGERSITGTAYYRAESDAIETSNPVDHINTRFSIRSPQREAHLREDAAAVNAATAEGRITGTFAAGTGKITGNQEFHFSPRGKVACSEDKSRISGEGRMEGPAITGGAWGTQKNVSGTEGYISAERNPSERDGSAHTFASASKFKGKGNHVVPTQHVTGMVGWSSKTAARVTMTGGSQG